MVAWARKGDAEAAVDYAELAVTLPEHDFLGGRYLVSYVDCWRGPDARTLANIPAIGNESEPSRFDQVYGGSISATMHAYAGNVDHAATAIRIASDAMRTDESDNGEPRSEYLGLVAFARCALAVAEGDEAEGAAVLRDFFAAHALSTPIGRRCARRWLALPWVLLPELRTELASLSLGPAMQNVMSIGEWFTQLRNGHFTNAPVEAPSELVRALPLRWAVEAIACMAANAAAADDATALAEQLVTLRGGRVRDTLRGFVGKDHPEAAVGAKRLLASVPVSPSHPLAIGVLGPLELRRDVVIDVPELRRGRVRQLIVALAVDGAQQREVLADRLWPDVDRAAALQNLRQTINYAHKALEPERAAGDAPFVLRIHGDLLVLVGAPWVQLDVLQFRELSADASRLRRAGVHSEELAKLEEALAFVRAEPLIDVAYEEWAAGHIRSMTVAIASAAQRAAEIRFAMADHERAQAHAALCVRFDPWCESAHSITTASLLSQGRVGAARESFQTWKAMSHDLGGRIETGAMAMLERRLGVS